MKDLWTRDARNLAYELPSDDAITQRVDYLLEGVMYDGVEIDPTVFSQESITLPSWATFMLVDKALLSRSQTRLGEMARELPGVAFVAHSPSLPSIMALPSHDATSPLGNGHILLHELEHLTEVEAGILSEPEFHGVCERRAYRTNGRVMQVLDGSDFERYLDTWPVTFTVSGEGIFVSTAIRFHDTVCPEPPKETYAYDFWAEGLQSQQVLQSIGRMAVLEKLTNGLSEAIRDDLAQGLSV